MTRIANYHQSNRLLQDVLMNQERVVNADRQVSTGHVAEHYKDIYQETTSLTGAKSLLSSLEQHEQNNAVTTSTLSSFDQSLAGMENAAKDLLDAVTGAVNASSGLGFNSSIEGVFDTVLSFLNIQTAEGYIYSGTLIDTAPVNITDISDLLTALEPPTDIFDNNSLKKTAKIDENRSLEVGILAEDVGLEIMTALQRIAMWQNGTLATTAPVPVGPAGPVSTPLATEDQTFLIGEIANLEDLVRQFGEARGDNGLNQKTLEETQVMVGDQISQTKIFISDIEDMDSVEAINYLNQVNFALEASYNVLGQVSQLSLLNFL